MSVSHARFPALLVVGAAETAGVRELKPDDEIVRIAEALLVRRDQRLAKRRDASFILFGDDQLIRIRPCVGAHRHRFSAKNQLRAALSETMPAPHHFLRDAASRRAIPTFHRLNGDAIADALAVYSD